MECMENYYLFFITDTHQLKEHILFLLKNPCYFIK